MQRIYVGAKEIGEAVRCSHKRVPDLVKSFGLPAWKPAHNKQWHCLESDLNEWLVQSRLTSTDEYELL